MKRKRTKIYVIGSMRCPKVNLVAEQLRAVGFDVFDDWHAPGPDTDTYWKHYEMRRGRSYVEALKGPHAVDVFEFDKRNLEASQMVLLVEPAGRSAHLELGWMLGRGKPGYVLVEPEAARWDIMLQFATEVFDSIDTMIKGITRDAKKLKRGSSRSIGRIIGGPESLSAILQQRSRRLRGAERGNGRIVAGREDEAGATESE